MLELDLTDDGAYDAIRDGAASLGLGLIRIEQRRQHLEDLFRDEAEDEAGDPCLSRRRSNIYDLGYRHYDGPRIGRRGTLLTLYVHSLRSAFGLGRRATSKIFPFALAVFAFVPAIIQLGVGAIVSGVDQHVDLFKHEDYFTYVRIILVLFCAAVAPELVGRDQRNRTLSLYFSRAVSRLRLHAREVRSPDERDARAHARAAAPALHRQRHGRRRPLGLHLGQRGTSSSPIVAGVAADLVRDRCRSGSASPPTCRAGRTRPRRSSASSCSRCPPRTSSWRRSMRRTRASRSSSAPSPGRVRSSGSSASSRTSSNVLADADFGGWVYLLAVLVTIAAALALTLRRFVRVTA